MSPPPRYPCRPMRKAHGARISPPTNQPPSLLSSHPLVSHAELSGGRGSFLLVLRHAKRSERFARCYSKRQNLTKCFLLLESYAW